MNIFTLMLAFAAMSGTGLGLICAIIFAVKRRWKGVLWSLGATGALWAVCLCGLYAFSYADDITLHRPVANAEVIGTWNLNDRSKELALREMPSAKNDAYRIELRADGTCRYFSFAQFPAQVLDVEGAWKIRQRFGTTDTWELSLDLPENNFTLAFMEEDGRLFLWEYWGDPDGMDLLRYEKRSAAPAQ